MTSVRDKDDYLPQHDGKSHINIYSRGRTALGRMLSNPSFRRFVTPNHGSFCSMEGYYYYIATGGATESLRRLHGIAATKEGKKHKRVECDNFEELMREGLRCSYINNQNLYEAIMEQLEKDEYHLLPFVHYYMNADKVITPKGDEWLADEWTAIRNEAIISSGYSIIEEDSTCRAVKRVSDFNDEYIITEYGEF